MTYAQLRRLQRNSEYWRQRERTQRAAYLRIEDKEIAEINRIYDDMFYWAEREINEFYGKYADKEGIDITEAKKRVGKIDIERYEALAKQYVEDRDFSKDANNAMRIYNSTMRINRLELLKAQIGLHVVAGIDEIDKHYENIATDLAYQELQRQAGILGDTLTDTKTAKTARQIVNATFYNATFSERIWSHQDRLRSALSIELQRGLIAGVGSREMANNLRKQFDVSRYDAERLTRTELRRVQTDVARDSYKENGIEQYEFMAVNPAACPICKALDGNKYYVRDMVAGENAPPIHPNCHCTTAPYIPDDDYEEWLTFLENGGTTEEYRRRRNL